MAPRSARRSAGLERHHHHARGGDQDGERQPRGHGIAEQNEPEQRDLHRLGLDIRDADHERALVHRRQHQGGGGHLRQGAVDDPGPIGRARARQARATGDQHARQEQQRKRKSEQEADMRRPHRAERGRELPLRSIAHGLAEGRNDRKQRPEP
jgi:hypothetical protein